MRKARTKAHEEFDRVWKKYNNQDGWIRQQMYRALAKYLGLSIDDCHIAAFDEYQCEMVSLFVKKFKYKHTHKSPSKPIKQDRYRKRTATRIARMRGTR
jgi:hypothetical protein